MAKTKKEINKFLKTCIRLSEVSCYIENVKSRVPHNHEHYGFMATWLCAELNVHPKDWLMNWEMELGLI